jgi:hypothetical protein
MASFRTDLSEAGIEAMARDWDSPIGRAVYEATGAIEDEAKLLAPVSATGSRYAPPGHLLAYTRQSEGLHHDELTGYVKGLVGAPRMPYNFIANPTSKKGWTWNRGRKTTRPADDRFLERSANSFPFAVWRV